MCAVGRKGRREEARVSGGQRRGKQRRKPVFGRCGAQTESGGVGDAEEHQIGRQAGSMGLISWVKRHYFHYSISTGTHDFYPAEKLMVNAFTMTLFSLTAYYAARSVWLGAVSVGDLLRPQPQIS